MEVLNGARTESDEQSKILLKIKEKFGTICQSDLKDNQISSKLNSCQQQSDTSPVSTTLDPIILCGKGLTIEKVIRIVRQKYPVEITNDFNVHKKMADSCEYIRKVVDESQPLYGVTTLFGGMAHRQISCSQASELQNNLVYFHKTGAGAYVPLEDARAAMLLRANSHLIGVSGIRMEITDRLIKCIKEQITPLIPEFGSVGASGDLVPLTYIVGSICGTNKSFKVNFRGQKMDATDALEQMDLKRLYLQPKEGLAMINGTSMMTASATIAVYDLYILFAATLHAHALAIQALHGNNQPFHPFLHEMKPHHGQKLIASTILNLLSDSKMINDHLDGTHNMRQNVLIQDRYSIRAMPQYLGPFIEGLHEIARAVEVEINSANDNPLIDVENQRAYAGANFFGEYISTAMDRLRYIVGLISKHLDVQIAQTVASEFSNGLPDCLISNPQREVNMGVKGLQLCANSIMPYLLFFGNSIADRYSTHAEQYNQNINSMGHVSANLARHSVSTMKQLISVALLIFVQGVDLRSKLIGNTYDARNLLSTNTVRTYESIREIVKVPISDDKPYIWNDDEQALDEHITLIADNLTDENSSLFKAIQMTAKYLLNDRHQ